MEGERALDGYTKIYHPPWPFRVTLKPFRVTLKGLGPMPIGALTPFPFGVTLKGLGVNPRVRVGPL